MILFTLLCIVSFTGFAQQDTAKWVRAFPVTDYITDLNDSIRLIQLYLPGGPQLKDKQVGVLRGVYKKEHADTSIIGAGRCHLVKGDYYYFSVNYKSSGRLPSENDLLYTLTDYPVVYTGRIVKVASHFIELQNVEEVPFFDRFDVFETWTTDMEKDCLASMIKDIHFTGRYFLDNDASMNVKIESGRYKDQMVLTLMTKITANDVEDFLDYMIARPRLYAGKEWKVSELFATWASSGAPTVVSK